MAKSNASGLRVYSYIRFSTPEQALGDSERRQLDTARAWATRKGLELDESLRMADRGVSGFRGAHRRKGALGQFLKSVEAGTVPRGSILVVENIDRLGREAVMDALRTILFSLIEYDITIQTLSPEATYDRAAINGYGIYELIGQIKRANDESQRKSDMVRKARDTARKAARESKKLLTRNLPAWLEAKDGKPVVIPEAAETIRRIFDMKNQGIGNDTIVRRLNADESAWQPTPRKNQKERGWQKCYVKKLLSFRAVLGEYQPFKQPDGQPGTIVASGEPILGYYPAIVHPEVFDAVQERIRANRGKGGRTGKVSNLIYPPGAVCLLRRPDGVCR